jgi:hypothetical protein
MATAPSRSTATGRPGDRATGKSYRIAHHLFTEEGERKLMVAWLRYGDTFVKAVGRRRPGTSTRFGRAQFRSCHS